MPKVSAPFLVLDDETSLPLPGASVYMVYEGPRGELEQRGPFVSDETGRGLISLKKEVLWVSWSEAYFAGGYLRRITAQASGYESGGFREGFDYGAIEKQGSFVFRLKPFRNRFGSVLVIAHQTDGDRDILKMRVLDGPHSGETIELRVFDLNEEQVAYLGNKYYLRQSLESIYEEKERYSVVAFRFDNVLREGLPDEVYAPQ